MQARYIRNIPALKEEECRVLQTKRVLVVGCGGLGGHIIDMLCRLGVGALRVVDGDVFEETNLNRQLLSQLPLLGVNKARAAADHIRSVNPTVETEAVESFLSVENADAIASGMAYSEAFQEGGAIHGSKGCAVNRTIQALQNQAFYQIQPVFL